MKKKIILLIISLILISSGIIIHLIIKSAKTYTVEKEFKLLTNYTEYQNLINETDIYNYNKELTINDFIENNYIFVSENIIDSCTEHLEYKSYKEHNNKVMLYFDLIKTCGGCAGTTYGYFIPINKTSKNITKVETTYTISGSCNRSRFDTTIDKPILYLYPKEKEEVSVKLQNDEKIITSYPKYINEWNVTAYPNGDLYDQNGNYYYALYWDEASTFTPSFEEGFVVTKENALSFLEEKLSFIGLNNKERNEFIMYWLPKLEKNEKNLVYFELTEEREKHNKLIINPIPDSLLRINMHIKKIDNNENINIKEQKLYKTERIGFTAIEWGGTSHN